MRLVSRTRSRSAVATLAGATLVAVGAATLVVSQSPAAAGIVAAVTTVTCSVTGANWCISGNNTSSGIGVIGTSKTGTGLRGTSTSQYGLKATSVSGTAILAQTTTGLTAVSVSTGNSTAGSIGVLGTSPIGIGVEGFAVNNNDTSKGVYGYSLNGYGLFGSSPGTAGFGVEGTGGSLGVLATSPTGTGIQVTSGGASRPAAQIIETGGGDGIDVTAQASVCPNPSNCAAVSSQSKHGYAYIGSTGNDGVPLLLNNSDGGGLIFWVSNRGDVNYAGSLGSFVRVTGGATVKTFSAKTSMPAVEDFGTAQLVAGAATVPLDATFASSIDPRTVYRVFLTPNGDTHGLYVASKTPAGFVVRETSGGHGNLSFDYRIVATALGQSGKRMAVIDPATLPHVTMPTTQPLKADRPEVLPALP